MHAPLLIASASRKKIEFPVKDVVAQNQACAGVANKFGADQKSLGDAPWFRLFRILDFDSKLRAVAQEIPQHGQVFRCGNDKDNRAGRRA